MKPRNFIGNKTGHHASDEYFKNTPSWFDTEMITVFLGGVGVGIFSWILFGLS